MTWIIMVRVVPRSKKQSCGYDRAGRLTIHVRAVPEKNAANNELLAYLASKLNIATSHVALISGATSRMKRVTIDTTMPLDELYRRLGLEQVLQTQLFVTPHK